MEIEKAIAFAANAHYGTKRKGKKRPYILHPLEVMLIVADITEDEDVIAAAVLHDTVEDTSVTAKDIRREFGERVSELVAAESENKRCGESSENTWQIRKCETIDHIKTASRDAKLICLGDKLANLREIARDYAKDGDALWQRFNQKEKGMHGWYYGSLYEILRAEFGEIPAIIEYGRLLKEVFGERGTRSTVTAPSGT